MKFIDKDTLTGHVVLLNDAILNSEYRHCVSLINDYIKFF